jgi:hypothetical protein
MAEEKGSIVESRDAPGYRNLQTTRVYLTRIAIKRDKYSRAITSRLSVGADEYAE